MVHQRFDGHPFAPFIGVWARTHESPAVLTLLPEENALWCHFRPPWDSSSQDLAKGWAAHLQPLAPDEDSPRCAPVDARGAGTFQLRPDLLVVTVPSGGRPTFEARLEEPGRLLVGFDGAFVENINGEYRSANVKQVMVYRRDLAMRKGKIAAQCAHASMAVFFRRDEGPIDRLAVPLDGPAAAWAKGRFAKVVLSVEGEDELLRIHALAQRRGLPSALITDSGKTEFRGQPTRTTVALGPAVDVEIDAITGPDGLVPTKLA